MTGTGAGAGPAAPRARPSRARPSRARPGRAWAIVGALSVTETISWGILYYGFAVFLGPMQRDLGHSATELTGAFSLALLISAVAGLAVGRHLDRHGPRALMTAGSAAGVVLVLAWSRAEGLAAFYALWAGIGVVMAAVLYEPAFTVLAKWFPEPRERRRAMTAVTLAGALASFLFLPLAQALITAHGWRDALLVLAAVLAVGTVPLHAAVLRPAPAPAPPPPSRGAAAPASVRAALRSRSFQLLTGAFFLATAAGIGVTIQGIPFLLERGHSPSFAAFAIGLIGVAQIPGRVLYGALAERLPDAGAAVALLGLIAAGIALMAAVDATAAVLAGMVALGMGNGMATLARATVIADRYGATAYGTIAAVAASATIGARAAAPVAAAAWAALVGHAALLYTLAALAAAGAALAWAAGRPPAAAAAGPRRLRLRRPAWALRGAGQ